MLLITDKSKFVKTVFTILILLITTFAVVGQNFVYSTVQHVDVTSSVAGYKNYDIKFSTPNPEEITYKWVLLNNVMPQEWFYTICDYGGCYSSLPNTGVMNLISMSSAQNGTEGFFKLTLNPYGSGVGNMSFYVYDDSDSLRGDTVSFRVDYTDVTGLVLLKEESASLIYPNPATNKLNFSGISDDVITIIIRNVLGETIYEMNRSGSKFTIDVDDFNRGVYFISFGTRSGGSTTQRVIFK